MAPSAEPLIVHARKGSNKFLTLLAAAALLLACVIWSVVLPVTGLLYLFGYLH